MLQENMGSYLRWPLPNVWLGVSCEDRKTYLERVPSLALTPAAVRFVSMEPLLESLGDLMLDGIYGGAYSWAIVGGESGHGARSMDVQWVRSVVEQCRNSNVACFVKQLGAHPFDSSIANWEQAAALQAQGFRIGCSVIDGRFYFLTKDRKGGDMAEWPEDLRIREFPK